MYCLINNNNIILDKSKFITETKLIINYKWIVIHNLILNKLMIIYHNEYKKYLYYSIINIEMIQLELMLNYHRSQFNLA